MKEKEKEKKKGKKITQEERCLVAQVIREGSVYKAMGPVLVLLMAGCVGWRKEWGRERVPGKGTGEGTQHQA